ncbi:Zn-dependent exopeptidase M28 [bacterium]|nr:Zn-dependent exopeptidase M28 [bacterium]
MELISILEKIAIPRPNHSEAVKQTAVYLKDLLSSRQIPFSTQEFSVRCHQTLLLGVTIIILSVLFLLFIKTRRPFLALFSVLAILGVIILENETSFHTISSLIQRPGENIFVEFKTPGSQRELVFAAHYDSKTDVLDHEQRSIFLKLLPYMLVMGILISFLTYLSKKFKILNARPMRSLYLLGAFALVVFSLSAFAWLGGYIFLGEDKHSPGAVDDGASVAILLKMADEIHQGNLDIGQSDVTILLTDGEEVGYQGAYHYTKEKYGEEVQIRNKPVYLFNLELMGQSGTLYHSQKTCSVFVCYPADADLIARVVNVWSNISDKPAEPLRSMTDDSFAFGAIGIPFVTIGNTGLPGLGYGGFHSTTDGMSRVDPENLQRMSLFLEKIIESY